MKIRSVCKFTLFALPVSYIVMLCGLTLSKWPLFIYDTSMKPPLQILSLYEVLWPTLFWLLATVGIEIIIWKTLAQLKNASRLLNGIYSFGTKFTVASLLCLYLFLGIMIFYYIYRWHDVFMYYRYHLHGDITFIIGLSMYIILLSFFIISCNRFNSKLVITEDAAKL